MTKVNNMAKLTLINHRLSVHLDPDLLIRIDESVPEVFKKTLLPKNAYYLGLIHKPRGQLSG